MTNVERPIVAKFGGTSVADAEHVKRVGEIVASNPDRRVIVPSAPGKRNKEDQKITDLLLECNLLTEKELLYEQAFEAVSSRFEGMGRGLSCHSPVVGWLDEVHKGIDAKKGKDWIASRGEWVTGQILARFLGGAFIDADKLIILKEDGQIDPLTYQLIKNQISRDCLYVIPGFYGKDTRGIKIFARGGSDITGAIVAKGVDAKVYENWTDTNGVMAADPRLVANPKTINELTYREMRELGYRGADVLQMDAVLPVIEAGIPINIRNTFNPQHPGTMIIDRRDSDTKDVIGIAGRKDFVAFKIEKTGMNRTKGAARQILQIFEESDISFEHAPTSLDAMSVIFQREQINGKEAGIRSALDKQLNPDKVSTVDDFSLICVVGQGIPAKASDVHATLFSTLKKAGINVLSESYSVNGNSIVIAVANEVFSLAVNDLYDAFIRK
ncbi:MAG: hypothetical protein A2857_06045 [Candidatus Levybacteria bacterium RIFCSPHIGHO2_01_FULL_36_15]|nr:MAG: hypothetical protein A2857_06045 [Candidatus Levybacteria bacterium RIFCSPHIGHO2_01_FULL_36_15]OGH37547.1 MAG: hypothetical protein A2905_01250 [Candidatus Levybacteria bacterium RIFCSPLOWO2_01_FULL_36_10]